MANFELRIGPRAQFVLALALALGVLVVPFTADAQQPAKVYRIGWLGGVGPTTPEFMRQWEGFAEGFRERGYIEGQNFVIEFRFTGGQIERSPSLAAMDSPLFPDPAGGGPPDCDAVQEQ